MYILRPLPLPFSDNPAPVIRHDVHPSIKAIHESVFGRPQEEITLKDRHDMPPAIREFAVANGIPIV